MTRIMTRIWVVLRAEGLGTGNLHVILYYMCRCKMAKCQSRNLFYLFFKFFQHSLNRGPSKLNLTAGPFFVCVITTRFRPLVT
jgi:hypothetical protein